jgi:hypothetical protein
MDGTVEEYEDGQLLSDFFSLKCKGSCTVSMKMKNGIFTNKEWKSEEYKDGGWFCSYQEWKCEGYKDGGWFCSYQEWKWWRRGGVLGRTEPGGRGEVGGRGWGERRERLTGTGADVRTPFMKTEKDGTLLQRRL